MRGIILANVGTPAACTKRAVRRFIADMLGDPLVFGKPRWVARLASECLIAPLSAEKSLEKYRRVWRTDPPKISPMLWHMQRLATKLESAAGVPVEIACRYGLPSIENALTTLKNRSSADAGEVVIFPLYPHYAQSTTRTLMHAVERVWLQQATSLRLRFVEPYFSHPAYIRALAENTKPHLQDSERLVFVYHSLPLVQAEMGQKAGEAFDYVHQIHETNRLLCEALGIDLSQTALFYSSQKGCKWLTPFLDTDIATLPSRGWNKVAVVAPGFTADNMETLFDIDIEARARFMAGGGARFTFVPALNDSSIWVSAIREIIGGGGAF